jgi:cytoskeleton protein RodZ
MSELDRPAPADPSAEPGAVLAAARRAQNLTIADIARHLKLSSHQVEALETGAHERLPGPVFVRGFIRNYARLLKLDPDELVRAMAETPPAIPREAAVSPDIPYPTAATSNWPRYAALAAVIVTALAIYEFVLNEPESTVTKAPERAAVPAVVAETPAAPGVAPAASPPQAALTPEPAPSGPSVLAPPSARPPAAAVEAAIPAPAESTEKTRKPGQRELRFAFEGESWVRVEDGRGHVILSQLNAPGTTQRVYGTPPLTLIVGNSQVVRMMYEEKPVDLAAHTKVDVARFTLQ